MTTEQSLILPNKREVLLMKLNKFKVNNLNARDKENYDILVEKSTSIFVHLCWSKLGVSLEQLKKLNQQDLNELAAIIYGESRLVGFIQTSILTCIPVIGWRILIETLIYVNSTPSDISSCYKNMRYYWWYKRIKNKYGKDFTPSLNE